MCIIASYIYVLLEHKAFKSNGRNLTFSNLKYSTIKVKNFQRTWHNNVL